MTQNRLFKQLCRTEIMQIGWHLAHADSRDNFVLDPVGYADFASNLGERLRHLMEQVQAYRYRPRHLLDIDVPKSGLSVRPGNVLPLEESILLHGITYLLAPLLDKKMNNSVYSYRLHPDWQKRVKKRDSLFRESRIELPFLKRATIRSISPFDAWYERWPEFEKAAVMACTQEGYTHLTKTDITAYFENIDLRLLETQIRLLLKREEDKIIQLLFRILDGWTRITSTGTPVGRGIPQGNEVSSFLGNIYLIPLDRELIKFCRQYKAKWFRYVDDVKVFTRSEKDARQAVFVINDALRALHLNLQGSKTEILTDKELIDELDNTDLENVEAVFKNIERIDPDRPTNAKQITMHLQGLGRYVSRFRRNPQAVVKNLEPKQNRLFRRLMTIYGFCGRPHLRRTAMAALRELPDLRILDKALSYLSQLEYATHDETIGQLFGMLETGQLPFPYQVGSVLEAIAMMHPQSPKDVASRARKYGLAAKQHWFVTAKALEVISAYPYHQNYAKRLANKYLTNDHPIVRRASCVLLLRGPKTQVCTRLRELIYHPDPDVSRLALYFLRLLQDNQFSLQELTRLMRSKHSDITMQRNLPCLYAMASTENKNIAEAAYDYLEKQYKSKSTKLNWHRDKLLHSLGWIKKKVIAEMEL
ncbi:MAG: RNA-directed DNA polymerase [Candidatus Brocadiales bacterium]|nr:RNA-directed DNA polymerase [Candidatus Brocadiales bacterium]